MEREGNFRFSNSFLSPKYFESKINKRAKNQFLTGPEILSLLIIRIKQLTFITTPIDINKKTNCVGQCKSNFLYNNFPK